MIDKQIIIIEHRETNKSDFTKLFRLMSENKSLVDEVFLLPVLISVEHVITAQEYEHIVVEMREEIMGNFSGEFYYDVKLQIILFVVTKIYTFSKQILKHKLRSLASKMNVIFYKHCKTSISVVIGNSYGEYKDMIHSINELVNVSEYYLLSDGNCVFREDIIDMHKKIPLRYAEKLCDQILYHVEQDDIITATEEVKRMFSQIIDRQDLVMFEWVKYNLYSRLTIEMQKRSRWNAQVQVSYQYPNYTVRRCLEVQQEIISTIEYIGTIRNTDDTKDLTAVEKASIFIKKNYRSPITLAQVSEHIGISREHICRLFSREFQCSFVEYVNGYRIDKAKEYFFTTEYNVSQVAELVGFSSSKYFCSIFKKLVGITPKQFQMDSRLKVR